MSKNKQFRKKLYSALMGWHKNSEAPESLLSNLQLVQQKLGDETSSFQLRYQTNKVIEEGLTELEAGNPEWATILRRRFRKNDTIKHVAVSLNLSDDQVNRRQREAIDELSKIIWKKEQALRKKIAQELEQTLPVATYKELFGFTGMSAEIVSKLIDPKATGVVAITGIGGIGKTSLADAVTRQTIREFYFDKVIWLRVDPATISGKSVTSQLILDVLSVDLIRKLLPNLAEPLMRDARYQRIRTLLSEKKYLIVIDNVETDADTGMLMQHLNDWAGISKFLMTTRTRLTGQTSTLSYPLTELPKIDAMHLIASQAELTGLHDFSRDAETVIDDVYDVTGGNPLALKLVVSLVAFMSLDHVLSNLRQGGKKDDIEGMYMRVYRQAWTTLKDDAKQLLQAMPLVGEEGGAAAQLKAISRLDEDGIWAAITDLVNRSLIEVRGDYRKRRYGVHRLTMTFLQTEIIGGDWIFA